MAAVAGCGDDGGGIALEQGDPLHENAIGLPPPVEWEPLDAPAEPDHIRVPPPPFSKGIFPCSRCHAGGPPATDTAPALPHKAHLDRDLECADCHMPDDGLEPSIPTPEACFECHEDLSAEPAAVREYFASIKKTDKYVFPRRWQTGDVQPNHAKHASAGIDCSRCHGEPADTPFPKPRAVPLMERCIACHEDRKVSVECQTCHASIREPQHKAVVLRHAEAQRGCFGCHNPEDRDTLRLASGKSISFDESYVLCGQCHGTKLRDWKIGLHGKRTGMWDGRKEYLLCVHCHQDPHAPQFPLMRPDPPPTRPEDIR